MLLMMLFILLALGLSGMWPVVLALTVYNGPSSVRRSVRGSRRFPAASGRRACRSV
ncbi:hypothetical protein [Tessaracoccus coleopterorum]|uniref:hypothetical protein n=1 Tax=Tessaracoccus coleopterorum TaxID=2714950 RepID=UPI001E4F0A53|nr:hypothetical protein [Tessaracoccus coleopterorum]